MDVCWGEGFLGQGEWNDHGHRGKGGVLGEWRDCLMFRQGGLEVLGHGWNLCGLYGVELGYDT
jgi:hypothetical protein